MPPQKNQPVKRKSSRRFVLAVLLTGVVATLFIVLEHRAVYDWARLYGYQPPENIVKLANDDELTAGARRVFLVNHPQVQSKSAFAASCPNGNKETAVLGCYIPDQRGIYVLSVADPRLEGIEQVTAAHELLHAEYDRLGSSEKQRVNGWLQDYYEHGLNDPTIQKQLDSYKKTEPNDLVNEMHSIFGTEVADLPANLQQYYAQYFTNRSKVTGYYQTYEAEFASRISRIKQDDTQLATLKAQIKADEADLKTRQAQLEARQAQLVSDRRSGNVSAYNAGVSGYNALVDAYNAEVRTVQDLINQYNQLVAARNAIALEEQQLTQAISSQVSPINNQ